MVRSYSTPKAGAGGIELGFAVTNVSPHAVEIGAFGMSTPGGSDAHMGMAHGWVQYTQLYDNQRTIIVTPLNADSPLESWRPVMEYGGGGWEWATQTKAWAEEWVENKQYGGWQIITAELATYALLGGTTSLRSTVVTLRSDSCLQSAAVANAPHPGFRSFTCPPR